MVRFILFFLLVTASAFSQVVTDSLGTVIVEQNPIIIEPNNELQAVKTTFNETVTQENRNEQYLTEIIKSNETAGADVTKNEIDLKFSEQFTTTIDPITGTEIVPIEEQIIPEPVTIQKEEVSSLIEEFDDNLNNRKRIVGPRDYDTRIELLQLNPNNQWQLAIFQKSNSVAMLVEKEKVSQVSKEIYTVDISHKLGLTYNLCLEEAFYEQPIVGTGTAFIFSENSMITAKHVFERKIEDYVVVFGYRIVQSNGVVEVFFDKNNLYYPNKIKNAVDELDIIEFEVDRTFVPAVLEWENSLQALQSETNEIYMIGHPNGLPMKVALNALIEKEQHPHYFYTTLDSYQGNSGSPVFNFYTNKVIGVLVAGEKDYTYNGNCYYSSSCIQPYCKGEKVIRIEEIINRFNR